MAGCTLLQSNALPKGFGWTVVYTSQGLADPEVAGTVRYRITGLPRRTDAAALILGNDTLPLQPGANGWVGGRLRQPSEARTDEEAVWLEWTVAGRIRFAELDSPDLVSRVAAE
jgi:hypothetical protein